MEHMYFLADPIAALEEMEERVPIIRDPGDDFYSRQEKRDCLSGYMNKLVNLSAWMALTQTLPWRFVQMILIDVLIIWKAFSKTASAD